MRCRGALLLLGAAFFISRATACLVLGPAPTFLTSESAVIIWNSKTHTEHFIRRAGFDTNSPELGFLVPTPNVPELAEANPKIFELARDVSQPIILPESHDLGALASSIGAAFPAIALIQTGKNLSSVHLGAPSHFSEIKEQDVAGFHVTVFQAENPEQIKQWCDLHHFPWSPADSDWLGPYLKKHWSITAFQLINPNKDTYSSFYTRAIRMSFETEQPYYPYSEPDSTSSAVDQLRGPRLRNLDVAILSDSYMTGKLEEGIDWPCEANFYGISQPDPAFSSKWKEHDWITLANLPDTNTANVPLYLSTYSDDSFPRPGHTDLIFSPSPETKDFRREIIDDRLPPKIQFDVLDMLGFTVFLFVLSSLIYGSVRAYQIDREVARAKKLLLLPTRSTLVFVLDSITGVVIYFYGFAFSCTFLLLPIGFFIKTANLLGYQRFINQFQFSWLDPRGGISGRFSVGVVLFSAVIYVMLFVTILNYNLQAP